MRPNADASWSPEGVYRELGNHFHPPDKWRPIARRSCAFSSACPALQATTYLDGKPPQAARQGLLVCTWRGGGERRVDTHGRPVEHDRAAWDICGGGGLYGVLIAALAVLATMVAGGPLTQEPAAGQVTASSGLGSRPRAGLSNR
jgi:hypothetical protein